MASSKSVFLLLCALFALVFIFSSEVSTSDAISRDSYEFGDLKVSCQSPLRCRHYNRQGYCTSCSCCEGSRDENQLVLASLNNQFGIDCYGLSCCHYNRQGYCTACCSAATSEEARATASLNNQFGIDCYGLSCCHYNRQGYCTACCSAATSEEARATDLEATPANEVEDIELIKKVAK